MNMDPFLYNLFGYPLWRKRPEVVAVFDLPQARPLRALYEFLSTPENAHTPVIARVQFAAATLAWSRMFAAEDQSHVGGKLEDYLLAHPIPMPTDLMSAQRIGSALCDRNDPVNAYCFSFQAIDPLRRVLPEAEKWQMMLRDKTGQKEWYTRDGRGRLKWLDR